MDQIIGCLVTTSFSHTVRMKVLCCLENLSYNCKSHHHLVSPHVIHAIMGAASMQIDRTEVEGIDPALSINHNTNLIK